MPRLPIDKEPEYSWFKGLKEAIENEVLISLDGKEEINIRSRITCQAFKDYVMSTGNAELIRFAKKWESKVFKLWYQPSSSI